MSLATVRLCSRSGNRFLHWRTFSTSTGKKTHFWTVPIKKFNRVLEQRPYTINCFLGGLFSCAGDLIQQCYFNDKIKWKEVSLLISLHILFYDIIL